MRYLNKDGFIDPYEDWHNPPAVRVPNLMSRMTLHEKAMQLFFNAQVYPDAGFAFGPFQASDLFTYQLAAATNRLGIPFLSAGDTVAGYKTTYPTEPGLAATRDLPAVWAVADVQRRESVAIGYRGTLSPLAEVGTKVLYPRIQEGGGEDADLVAGIIRAMVVGLQGGPEINPQSIMITTKHWPGQGGGGESGIVYDGTTIHYHMRPWHAAIEAGASTIMPGYAGSILLGPQGYGAGDNPSIIAYLRTNMNYTGVICTDWLPSGDWVRAATAGSDVMGGADPLQMGTFETDVPAARIDEAVRRVLDLKFRMGIFEDPYGSNVNGAVAWHTPQNVALVHQTAVESLTLLKNDGALPLRLPAGSAIVVAGPRADDPSCMVTWRSDFHNNDFGSKTIYQAISARAAQDGITVYKNAAPTGATVAAAIVVVGESYYTHGTYWDKNSPYLPDDPIGPPHDTNDAPQYGIIQAFRSNNVPTTTICLLPRPYVLTNVAAFSDALMVVYRPGDEGGPAIAETLFGDHTPSGKTPWQLPRGMDQVGIDDPANWNSQPDKWDLPFDLGATTAELGQIRAEIAAGLPVPPTTGDPLFQYGSGIQGFGLTDTNPPLAFTLLTPTDGQNVAGAIPAFTWQSSSDPETGIARYELYVDDTHVATSRKATTYSLNGTILGNGAHSWYVKAYNWANGVTISPTFTFTINDVVPPAPFRTLLPTDGATVNTLNAVVFYWEQTTDTGTGVAEYILEIDGTDVATVAPSAYVSPTQNLAIGRAAYASSTSFGTPASAVDGDLTTRWSSDWIAVSNADTEWFTVDLGATYSIKEVVLMWEAAYGKEYLIQVSSDNATWNTIYHKTGGTGGTNDLTGLAGAGRYVRLQGVQRGTGYGYSLWEFQVFGLGTEQTAASIPNGTHAWQVRAIDGAGNVTTNTNGSLTIIGPLTPLQQWRQTNFGTINPNDSLAGDTANPAGDGLVNLLKYALGIDPHQATAAGLPTPALSNGTYLSLTFTGLRSATDITYHVEVSGDLGAWNEIWNSTVFPYGGGISPAQQVTVADTVPISVAPGGRRFLRLRVSRP
jgi:beta-glucosidase-like glycosyl hydrolase